MKLRPRILLLGSLMAAAAASLGAQPHENPFEVSPFVGHLFGGTVFDLRTPVDSDLSFDLKPRRPSELRLEAGVSLRQRIRA